MNLIETRRGEPGSRPRLTAYAWFVAFSVVFLLMAGAMVTSTGSGLAVPDWPLSFGQVMPPMTGGVFYEHGHRMVATTVGLLTVILAAWLWIREPRAWVRRLGWTAVGLVIVQGLLGGLTVLLRLPLWTSSLHACVAQTFFMLVVFLALVLTRGYDALAAGARVPESLTRWSAATTGIIYIQLILGALMRHLHAGLVIPDFPLVYGGLWPASFSPEIGVHLAHRLWAIVVVVAVLRTWAVARRTEDRVFLVPARVLGALLVVQIALGASVIWTARHPVVTSAHVVTGALLLGTATFLTARVWRRRAPAALSPSPRLRARETGRVPA